MDGKDFLIAAQKFVRSQFEAELASEIISQCDKEPLRSQIRTNIREYERKINL